jgi:plasmid stability protein
MHALTLRNIPADLFAFLRQDAVAHHRSLNKQAIAALDAYRQNQTAAQPAVPDDEQKRAQLSQRLNSIRSKLHSSANTQTADEILSFDANGLPQ